MPQANRGSVWIVDLGMAAKVRPCLVLTYVAQLGQNFHCFRLLGLQNPYVLRSGKVFLAM
jgi:hypothetical protein